LFEAARRSWACAYLADDDHGPLALQEILLVGCPTVGVRTGASFVKTGETGLVVDRLPPGRRCAETDADVGARAVFIEAIEQPQSMDRHGVRKRAALEFDSDRIVDSVIASLHAARLGGGIETAASVSSQVQRSIVDAVRADFAVAIFLKLVQLLDWRSTVHDCEHRSLKPLMGQLDEPLA
jgi:hypothetical protein